MQSTAWRFIRYVLPHPSGTISALTSCWTVTSRLFASKASIRKVWSPRDSISFVMAKRSPSYLLPRFSPSGRSVKRNAWVGLRERRYCSRLVFRGAFGRTPRNLPRCPPHYSPQFLLPASGRLAICESANFSPFRVILEEYPQGLSRLSSCSNGRGISRSSRRSAPYYPCRTCRGLLGTIRSSLFC